MKKIITLALVLCLSMGTLAACGGGNSGQAEGDADTRPTDSWKVENTPV